MAGADAAGACDQALDPAPVKGAAPHTSCREPFPLWAKVVPPEETGERAPALPDQVEPNAEPATDAPLRCPTPFHEVVPALDASVEDRPANPARFHWDSAGLGRAGVPKKLVMPCRSWCQTPGLLP